MYIGSYIGIGQAFAGNGGKLQSAKFYLEKDNLPTGNGYAKIYNIMWTYGSSAVPLYGSDPLAVSEVLDVSDLPLLKELITFNFTGANQIILGATTKYIVAFEWSGGDASNRVGVGLDHTSPTHPGNACLQTSLSWGYEAGYDTCFYIYTGDEIMRDIIGGSNIIPFAR